MRKIVAASIIAAGLVGLTAGAALRSVGCKASHGDVATFPFPEAELSHLPTTWYCLSSWSADRGRERQGMALFAWRLFIAINWPGKVLDNGKWDPDMEISGLNNPGTYPRWAGWRTPESLYTLLNDCGYPDPPRASWTCDGDGACVTPWLEGDGYDIIGSPSHACVYDQNGQLVHYEIRLGQDGVVPDLHRRVCPPQSECPGESDFDCPPWCRPGSEDGGTFHFNYGQCLGRDAVNNIGSMVVKLAWKVLSNEERESDRFLQRTARAYSACSLDGGEIAETHLGLVAFHIMQKTNLYRWIWSTFEHVNNLVPAEGARAASFNDPDCHDCLPNTSQRRPGSVCRTQITRTTPIPADVKALNEVARKWLKANDTVLQHYQLIDVQFDPDPDGQGTKDFEPRELRNPLIETYHVVGRPKSTQCGPEPGVFTAPASCEGCHSGAQVDRSFVIKNALCKCDDPTRRLGKNVCGYDKCERLGIPCPPEAPR